MDLARILLMDSANIQVQDAEYSNKHREASGLPLLEPLYNEEQAIAALRQFKIVEYGEEHEIIPRVKFKFTDAGHITGSAAIHLTIFEDAKETNITFSGDVGRYGDMLLKSPQAFPQADYIILESTYGDSLHKDITAIEDALLEEIEHTCQIKGGKLIIPAFSVGRTQELLYALNLLEQKGLLPELNYYVDSPLSEKATQVLMDHPEVYNKHVADSLMADPNPFGFKGLRFVQSTLESIALNEDPTPCVIISSSGMAEAGRVKHHIKNNIGNEKCTILIVGYCEPNSLGGHLARGDKEVHIFGERYDVRIEVLSIKSMSAHGDYQDLLRFLSCQDPALVKKIFLVHGEYEVQQHFKDKITDKGFDDVEIPAQYQKFNI